MIAEGGTGHNHAVTIARSKQITGPYENNHRNPILTHRHLGLHHPIVGTGHADLVETQNGEWWLVCLGMRPYGGYQYNLGRETFLAPIIWEEDWPIVAPGVGRIRFEGPAPDLPEHKWPSVPICDSFESEVLSDQWNFLRTPRKDSWSLTHNPGYLRLHLQPETLMERVSPSFIGCRQQHINFTASTAFHFSPKTQNECAGLVLLQNHNFHIRCLVTIHQNRSKVIRLIRREAGVDILLAETPIRTEQIILKVVAHGQDYQFSFAPPSNQWENLGRPVDGRVLSTEVAGGFTGAYIGMYASSNGQSSNNFADFNWFKYQGRA
jgi:alpha-N-arabinofuranosidase